jgi:hypothetical protein
MTDEAATQTSGPPSGRRSAAPKFRIGAVVAIALAIGLVLFFVLRDNGGDGGSTQVSSPVPKDAKAVPITVAGLRTIAGLGIPIYWIGEKAGDTYELAKTANDRVYIRYLPSRDDVATRKPYLTIGTYPMKAAYGITSKLSKLSTSTPVDAGKNAVAFYVTAAPTSVFLAYPGLDYQVEVFDPSPGRASELVSSQQIVRVK